MIKVKHRVSGVVLCSGESVRSALMTAVARGANLWGANLGGAYLRDANLRDADLRGADLGDADLRDADLRGADLRGADLRGADLEGADLGDAVLPEAPKVENLDARILAAIRVEGCSLDMSEWHKCETTHCRAGWAIALAGEEGRALEQRVGSQVAGALIYHASTGRMPDFFATNEEALADIERCAAEQSK